MKNIIVCILIITLNGCALLGQHQVRHHQSTPLVNFLYPDGEIPKDVQSPVLNLPLRVGLAFVPEHKNYYHNQGSVDNVIKLQLLGEIKREFADREYVAEITVIPETYLSHSQNTHRFDQLAQLYQLDVLALVSYDQIVNRTDNALSLSYLTIVGAYIFKGSDFDASTLLDLAVIDVKTKRLLFRAAGTHTSNGRTAEAYTPEKYLKHQKAGLIEANKQMRTQLNIELTAFEQRLRSRKANEDIQVVAKEGYQMNFNWFSLLALISLLIVRWWRA